MNKVVKNFIFVTSEIGMGGAERVFVNLANELSKRGYKVTMISMRKSRNPYKLNSEINHDILNYSRARKMLIYLFKKFKNTDSQTILLSTGHEINIVTALACFLSSKLNSLIIRPTNSWKSDAVNTNYIGNYLLKKFIPFVRKIIFQSEEIKDSYKILVNVDLCKKSFFLKNPVEDSFFHEGKKKKLISNTNLKSMEICFIGRLEKQKNPFFAIEIIKEMLFFNKNIKLNIYGEGSLKDDLLKKIKLMNLSSNINVHGFSNDVLLCMKSATLLLNCSHYEGLPNSVLEMCALGKPVVVPNKKFIPNEIKKMPNVIAYDDISAKEVAKIILNIDFNSTLIGKEIYDYQTDKVCTSFLEEIS